MARGTVNDEKVVSQAATEEYRREHERIFGDKPPQRGRWVATRDGLVPADRYVPEEEAKDAPIMVDRFYEGQTYNDGDRVWDLSSRRKYRQFMKEKGWTHASDYTETWAKAEEARRRVREEKKMPDRTRREAIERAFYEIDRKK